MSKEILVDPEIVQVKRKIELGDILVNSFDKTIVESLSIIEKSKAINIFYHMQVIRVFELMLDEIKKTGKYLDLNYQYAGPAHLSIGQEAAAVGQSLALGLDDFILGSHRSHGEVIAKGLATIDLLQESELESIYISDKYDHIRKGFRSPTTDIRKKLREFFIYGFIAEIFGKESGFNRGLGGSMHAFFPDFGIYPNNAIVGGSAPIATGMALFKRINNCKGIVVANIGDASSSCGPVWESMNFASMRQFETLFEKPYSGGLPIIFSFVNNFYGMGGQPIGETMGYENLARIGAGVNVHKMHASVVNGNDLFAVADAFNQAKEFIAKGSGPVLIDMQTYRFSGHSPSDASTYRTKDEIERWRAVDPVKKYRDAIIKQGLVSEEFIKNLESQAQELVGSAFKLAYDDAISPRLDLQSHPDLIGNFMFNNTEADTRTDNAKDLLIPEKDMSRIQALEKKERSALTSDKPLSGAKAITFRDAIFEAIFFHIKHDPKLVLFGEENRDWDGAFGVYKGLTEILPRHRLFNTAIAEAAIVGAGVGYAMAGGRALVELMYADFIGRAGDEIFNQMSKWQAMSGGLLQIPLVVRVSVGSKYGAQHSQDWSSLLTNIPGLKIVYPATAFDAKGLMSAALAGNNPVIFFENQRLYDAVETLQSKGVPKNDYRIEIGKSLRVKEGKHLTIFTVGATLIRALEVRDLLLENWNIEAEIIDARSMVPFDPDLLIESVKKTKNLICLSDSCDRGNWMHYVSSLIYSLCFKDLAKPIAVLAAPNWITPGADQEWNYLLTALDVLATINSKIIALEGFKNNREIAEFEGIFRAKLGI